MNAQERKALKRAVTSQDKWKAKAKERQKQIRFQQLTIRDLERSRTNWRVRFFQCKYELNKKADVEKQKTLQELSAPENQSSVERKKN